MTIRTLALCAAAAAGMALLATPVVACDTADCAAPANPLKLKSFMKKPIANAASRAVKTRDGSYARVSLTRRAKPAAATVTSAAAAMPAETAEAFALQEAALVRVVSSDEVNEIDLAADAKPTVTTNVEVVQDPDVRLVTAEEYNEIDRVVDDARAVSLDELRRKLAALSAEKRAENENAGWMKRVLAALSDAFTAASTAVKSLVGSA